MFAALNEQDFLCRVFGKTLVRRSARSGNRGSDRAGEPAPGGRSRPVQPKLFTYVRYNAELTGAGLTALGLPRMVPEHVQEMDSVDHILELQQVGRAVAEKKVNRAHFAGFLG